MASSVKNSFSRPKKRKKSMPQDDFYKEAQKEYIRDVVASGKRPSEDQADQPDQPIDIKTEEQINSNIVSETILDTKEEPVIVSQVNTSRHEQKVENKTEKKTAMQNDTPKNTEDLNDFDDFDFVDHYGSALRIQCFCRKIQHLLQLTVLL